MTKVAPSGFPSLLRRMRRRRHWSQAKLGQESGVDRSYLSRIESGERPAPRPHTLKALAQALCDDDSEVRIFMIQTGIESGQNTMSEITQHLIDHGEPLQKAVLALCRGWPIG